MMGMNKKKIKKVAIHLEVDIDMYYPLKMITYSKGERELWIINSPLHCTALSLTPERHKHTHIHRPTTPDPIESPEMPSPWELQLPPEGLGLGGGGGGAAGEFFPLEDNHEDDDGAMRKAGQQQGGRGCWS